MEKGTEICTQMIPILKRGETNYGIALKTTLMNTCRAIEEREWEFMLGVAMKTYIRDVDTKKKRERRC